MNKIIIVSVLLVALSGVVSAGMLGDETLSPEEVEKCVETFAESAGPIAIPENILKVGQHVRAQCGSSDCTDVINQSKADIEKFIVDKILFRDATRKAAKRLSRALINAIPARCIGIQQFYDELRRQDKGQADLSRFDYLQLCLVIQNVSAWFD